MTFTELSRELGVTPQAIYKRLQRASISLTEVKDEKTGELSVDGADRIRLLFRNSPSINRRTQEVKEIALSGSSKTALIQLNIEQGAQIERLKGENDVLRADLDEWKERYDRLLQLSFTLRADMVKAQQAAPVQPIQQEETTEQPQPAEQKKAGFFARIFEKKHNV